MTKILVLQGASVNWLGPREPEKYSATTAETLEEMFRRPPAGTKARNGCPR